MSFIKQYQLYQEQVNQALLKYFPADRSRVAQASQYSLMAGGKRLRPILTLAFYQALTGKKADVAIKRLACSLEYIHTFSLIHDDLPALDNDDYRRGLLTCHCKYDEATAILAGDYLLNLAYENLSQVALDSVIKNRILLILSQAVRQLICGEMSDLQAEKQKISASALKLIYQGKTAALFQASLLLTHLLASISTQNLITTNQLETLGQNLGLAFQIQDDVLDLIGDEKILGKKVKADLKQAKQTWVSQYGLAQAQTDYLRYYDLAYQAMSELLPQNEAREFLLALITYLKNRQK